jgi:hypothetical protein
MFPSQFVMVSTFIQIEVKSNFSIILYIKMSLTFPLLYHYFHLKYSAILRDATIITQVILLINSIGVS